MLSTGRYSSIAIYVFKKTLSTDLSNSIHVSLSAALFLLNVSFLFNELAVTWPIGACVFVAATIHYSLLCCFSWMVIEALHLYLLLVRVFNTYIRHYMIKLSLFSWGVPAVIVGLSLSVYNIKPFYGIKTKNMTDTNEVAGICWIIDDNFFYGVNLTYFTFTFLVNIAILSTVTCQICKLRHLGPKTSILPSCKDIGTVLGLSCLLGITWGLAFLTSGFTNYIILYLFCICNTLQGLFMFLWVYGTVRKNRRLATQNFTPSDHSSHSGTAAKTRETTLSDISNPS
ncbi:adhesion G protein-coupled receptor G3 [Salminus brasiliensis]|uniref:adhesion G protein-coupled receptor G3 n=1 Tax=Salminus brasiliensis TaxID=930266 RepID=UPI003B835947